MNCKHFEFKQNKAYCKALGKKINERNCRNCPLKLQPKQDISNEFKDVFGDIFQYN